MFSTDYSWPRAELVTPLPSSDDHFLTSVSLVLLTPSASGTKLMSPPVYTLWLCCKIVPHFPTPFIL